MAKPNHRKSTPAEKDAARKLQDEALRGDKEAFDALFEDIRTVCDALPAAEEAFEEENDATQADLWMDNVASNPLLVFRLLAACDAIAASHGREPSGHFALRNGVMHALALLADPENQESSMPASVLDMEPWFAAVQDPSLIKQLAQEVSE